MANQNHIPQQISHTQALNQLGMTLGLGISPLPSCVSVGGTTIWRCKYYVNSELAALSRDFPNRQSAKESAARRAVIFIRANYANSLSLMNEASRRGIRICGSRSGQVFSWYQRVRTPDGANYVIWLGTANIEVGSISNAMEVAAQRALAALM